MILSDVAKMAECNVRSYSADRHNDLQHMTLFQRVMSLATSKPLSLHAFLMAQTCESGNTDQLY